MANLKNITAEALDVPLLGRTVQPGETVDVSDYLLAESVWPASTWQISGTKVVRLASGDDAYRAPDKQPEPEPAAAPEPDKTEEA